jgi:hypothetical protein
MKIGTKVLAAMPTPAEAEFWLRNRELKPVYFPVSSRFLPGFSFPAEYGYFWLFVLFSPRFLKFVSFFSCFKDGTRASFSSLLQKVVLFPRLWFRRSNYF